MTTIVGPALALATLSSPVQASGLERTGAGQRCFAFGPFQLRPERQLLLKREAPVKIGGRALDLLTALVERPGELVDKRTLISRVWPHTYVEETNLKVNIAGLRRVLEDNPCFPKFIATVVGRGYRFIAPVLATGSPSPAAGHRSSDDVPNLVELLETINAIRQQLAQLSSSGQ